MLKKIISTALVLATASTAMLSGAVTANASSTKPHKGFKLVSTSAPLTKTKNIGLATYNTDELVGYVKLEGKTSDKVYKFNFADSLNGVKTYSIPAADEYSLMMGAGACGLSGNVYARYDFSETNTTYYKVKIKLSEFSNYFNADGTYTKNEVNYNFGKQVVDKNTIYSSLLVFRCGGMFTQCKPDKNGEVELYISNDMHNRVAFSTDFSYRTPTSSGGGGGINDKSVYKLYVGNVNNDEDRNVNDVTELQYNLAELKDSLDSLTTLLADTNKDGVVTVNDVTALQEYLAGY